MRLKNYDIHCYRGEQFTLDFEVINDDGSPYILAKGLDWVILFTISSVRYPSEEDIVEIYELDLSDVPTFETTQPISIDDFKTAPDENAVYYNGNEYKYYDEGDWIDYKLRITLAFTSEQTKNWLEQRYLYSIKLISKDGNNCTIILEPHNLYVGSDRTEV